MVLKKYAGIENGIVVNFIDLDENTIHTHDEVICLEDFENPNYPIFIGSKYENGIFLPPEKEKKQFDELQIQNEIDRVENLWRNLRNKRNKKLFESDIIMFKHIENGEEVPEKLKNYRNLLRDLPENVLDIEGDIDWPVYP